MLTVHKLAETYGVRPSDILMGGLHEFNLDLAICAAGLKEESKNAAK